MAHPDEDDAEGGDEDAVEAERTPRAASNSAAAGARGGNGRAGRTAARK